MIFRCAMCVCAFCIFWLSTVRKENVFEKILKNLGKPCASQTVSKSLIDNFLLFSCSGIADLLAWCEKVRHCLWRRPGHTGGHLLLLRDQCVCVSVAAGALRHRRLQNLQIGHTGRTKDKRWTSLQVSRQDTPISLYIDSITFCICTCCREYLELDLTLSQEKVQHIAGVAVAHLNGFTAELRRLFLVEDLIDSIKFGVILWVFTYIGAWFNGMTLVILGKQRSLNR